jgi:amino acid transporter
MSITRLNTFALVLLITGAIDSIRNLPATALFGSALIFFFIFSAVVFLIPAALVSAELSSMSTERGGIYHWVKLAFGEKIGFLAIWLQWINTMVWFPTILSFIAATAAYLINPELAQNKIYLVSIILITFWSLTLVNLKGVHISAKFANTCAFIGMVIPMLLIVALAIAWIILGKPLQIHLTAETLIPSFKHTDNWISLTAIMAAFLGMELATVHIREVNNPQKTFPKALFVSVIFILTTMILGALAIAFILPQEKISLTNGVMQAFKNFFDVYHISWVTPIIAIMILLGSLGGMISWIISPARGLLQAAQSGYLPKFLSKENQHHVAGNLLITQAILVSVVCLAFLLMPSVNSSYWLLTALSTQLYILMYVLMFLAAAYLRYKHADKPRTFSIPGGSFGLYLTCLLGLIGCGITLTVGFFPPDGINVGSTLHYETIFTTGMIAMILPALFFYYYKRKTA